MTYTPTYISLTKGKEVYRIDYRIGEEYVALSQIAEWAKNEELSFDSLDAALLALELGRKLEKNDGDIEVREV